MFEWKSIWASKKPDVGRAVVVLYADGSGVGLFRVASDDDGTVTLRAADCEEDDDVIAWDALADHGYATWAYLPADFKLWSDTP